MKIRGTSLKALTATNILWNANYYKLEFNVKTESKPETLW